jgi:cell division protein FtsN
MATDYKRRAEPRPSKGRTPCWIWFTSGLMLGVFACGLAWLKLDPRGPIQTQQVPGLPAQRPAPRRAEPVAPKAPPPRFDFYTILPETEVLVPQQQPRPAPAIPAAPAAAEQPQVAAPASADSYLLQAGAFSQRADAERLRASLALLGVEAEIQAGQGSDRQRVFRVRSGPYPSRAAVERARANLKRNGINSIAIKQGG